MLRLIIVLVLLATAIPNYLITVPCHNQTIDGCAIYNNNYTTSYWNNSAFYFSYCPCTQCNTLLFLDISLNNHQQCCDKQKCGFCQNINLTCTNCSYGYGFNITLQCVLCTTNTSLQFCQECHTIQTCIKCDQYHSLNISVCIDCWLVMPYCKKCYSTNQTCSQCNRTDYGYNSSNNPDTCQPCNISLQHCLTCWTVYDCTSCQNFNKTMTLYTLGYDICSLCSVPLLGCKLCTNQNTCIQCINNSYALIPSTHKCVFCNLALPYCQFCNSSIVCISCISNKFALTYFKGLNFYIYCQYCGNLMIGCLQCSNNRTCTICSRQCRNVSYGCTKVIGCISVDSLLDNDKNCMACNQDQFLPSTNPTTCVCRQGWLAGSHCTTIIGCIVAQILNNNKICVTCSYFLHFKATNGSCECIHGFFLNETGVCSPICGDGIIIEEKCDDGNRVNGDGCSSNCQIQYNYVCHTVITIPQSKCIFKGRITLQLNSINKVQDSNSILIVFDISPYVDAINQMDLVNSVEFNGSDCTVNQIYLSNHQLIVQIDYNQTIQGNIANITIKFDQRYIRSPTFNLQFALIQSNGFSLAYDALAGKYKQSNVLSSIVRIISILSIVMLFVGSFGYKMIGVETIHTIQLAFILMVHSDNYKSGFINFINLKIGYGQVNQLMENNNLMGMRNYEYLGYKNNTEIINQYLILGLAQILIILVYAGIYIRYRLAKNRKTSQLPNLQNEEQNLTFIKQKQPTKIKNKDYYAKLIQLIYDWVMFPLFIGFMFHFINTIILNKLKGSSNSSLYMQMRLVSILNLLIIAKSFIFAKQFKLFFVNNKNTVHSYSPLVKPQYIRHYLLYYFIILALQVRQLFYSFQFYQLTIVVILAFSIFYLFCMRPYRRMFDNLSVIYNQLVVLSLVICVYLMNGGLLVRSSDDYFTIGLIAALLVVLLLAIIRTALTIYQKCINKDKTFRFVEQTNIKKQLKYLEQKIQKIYVIQPQISQMNNQLYYQRKYMREMRQKIQKNYVDPLQAYIKNLTQQKESKHQEITIMKNIYREECRKKLLQK